MAVVRKIVKLSLKLLAQSNSTSEIADLFKVIEILGREHDEPAHLAELADKLAGVIAEWLDVALAQRTLIARVITA